MVLRNAALQIDFLYLLARRFRCSLYSLVSAPHTYIPFVYYVYVNHKVSVWFFFLFFFKLKSEFIVIVSNICAEFSKINKNSILLKFVNSCHLPFAWRGLDIACVERRNQVKSWNVIGETIFEIKFHFSFDTSNFCQKTISFNILDSGFFFRQCTSDFVGNIKRFSSDIFF